MTGTPALLRPLPMHYCMGCGHTTMHRLLAETLEETGLSVRAVGVCGVGCTFLMYEFLDIDFVSAPAGRAATVARGVKMALPGAAVFSYQGDSDAAGAGLADLMAAAGAGAPITVLVLNNLVTGLSGPHTTPLAPTPSGPALRLAETVAAVGGPRAMVARGHLGAPGAEARVRALLATALRMPIERGSFALLEVVSACPTHWGLSPAGASDRIEGELTAALPAVAYGVP